MNKLNVLVVDDSITYRKILSAAVEMTGMGKVLHTASNGVIALERLSQTHFDVVVMDIIMPEMDGIDTLKAIKKHYSDTEVILISGIDKDNAVATVNALEMGAMDFVVKPSNLDPDRNMDTIKNHLKILFTQININNASSKLSNIPKEIKTESLPQAQEIRPRLVKSNKLDNVDLVVIASSTGGPIALKAVCENISGDFKKPILIVQHMPPDFTKVLASSLNARSGLNIIEGQVGDIIEPGKIIIAPGGLHMIVSKNGENKKIINTENTPLVNGVKPSADVLFKSVADVYTGLKILAIVLTGMGSDGMIGVRELKRKCKCYCITQSEKTCVVYGMPRSVDEAGLSDETADISDIYMRIQQIASGRG